MPESVRVTCIRKRGSHLNPHERIEALGGVNPDGTRWYLNEDVIIAELLKLVEQRRWNFYVTVGQHTVWVILAEHLGRYYLKTQSDGYSPDNLLSLPECP